MRSIKQSPSPADAKRRHGVGKGVRGMSFAESNAGVSREWRYFPSPPAPSPQGEGEERLA
jgi:hypothetical protein